MRRSKISFLLVLMLSAFLLNAQGDVYVNMNMVHWVDTVSDFGRDRHLVIHSDATENDWEGENDKMDYLINDLDAYFGRDNGYASWHASQTPQDDNKPNWFDYNWMKESGGPAAKLDYSRGDIRMKGHQFKDKGHMIMGTNPQPLYPSLGTDAGLGWMPLTTETSSQWQGEYLDNYFSKGEGDAGHPIPEYWEVVNEIDMVMNLHGSYLITSYETIWRYCNQSAEQIKSKLGDKAPKVGGLTWGLHDFHRGDGITNRALGVASDKAAGYSWSAYEDMYISNIERNNYFADPWYQWDNYWQGFIDHCGDNMDFHSVHIYDWPEYDSDAITIRAGGHAEAMLDMLEWYDIKFANNGKAKEIVISEYGAVCGKYNAGTGGTDDHRRDWENLKPFSSMLMQFLERPNTIRLTSQFTPTKAHWGDGAVRYPYKMLDDVDGDGEYDWTDFIKFYELWSDVDGTRIETKSTDIDVQVDAYVDGNHMYLIVNNMLEETKTVNMHYYDDDNKAVKGVHIKTLWLDESIGNGMPTLTSVNAGSMPGEITLKPDATVILDVEFESALDLDQTCREYKIMGERVGTGTTDAGGQKFTIAPSAAPTQTMTIKNVPAFSGSDEVVVRVTGSFYNAPHGTFAMTVNGNLLTPDKFYRGEPTARHGQRLSTIEVDVPIAYLNEGDNTVVVSYGADAGFAVCQLQYWEFSQAPGRGNDNVAVTGVTMPSSLSMEVGETASLAATIAPANASDKTVTWSSNNSVVKVDEFGALTAVSAGSATITATAGGKTATSTVMVTPFVAKPVTGVSISEGSAITVGHRVYTRLTASIAPANASEQNIIWSSSDESAVSVSELGTVEGINIGESAVITAKVIDTYSGNTVHADNITVTVDVAGGEYVSCQGVTDSVNAAMAFDFEVTANTSGVRDVKLEIIQGAVVLGSGMVSTEQTGIAFVEVPVIMNISPTPGDYTVKAILLNGTTVLLTDTKSLYIDESIQPDSIAIEDWLWKVEKDGGTLQVNATVFPEDAVNKTIIWTSSDDNKAIVNSNGLITGGSTEGMVTITAKTQEGNVMKNIDVEVVDDIQVAATAITLPEVINLFPGSIHELQFGLTPAWANDLDITWTVVDESVVKFTSGNTIEAVGASGTQTTISGVYNTDPSIKLSATVVVRDVLYIEAEDFDATGGTYDDDADFGAGSTVPGPGANLTAVAINGVNSGDWMTYDVYFPESGYYDVTFYAGCLVDDSKIGLKVNGSTLGKVSVPNDDWDNYQPVYINDVYIEKGVNEIKLEGVGSSSYQWNLEHFEFAIAGPTAVTGIEVLPASWSLVVDGKKALTANVLPVNATNKDFVWSSDDTGVAEVSASGVVTAKGKGVANIFAITDDGSFKDSCIITVLDEILVTSIVPSPSSIRLSKGTTEQIIVTVLPEYAVDRSVSFSVKDNAIAEVSSTGLVTAKVDGNTVVVISANDASGVSVEIPLVIAPIPVESVSLLQTTVILKSIGATVDLDETVLPAKASNKAVEWSSSDESVVTVDSDGVVTAKAVGDAVITVTTDDGLKTATCSVEVSLISVESVSLSEKRATLSSLGETIDLDATVLPSNAADKDVEWSSDNESVVTVDSDGVVTAKGVGDAIVTVTTKDGSKKATCVVSVVVVSVDDDILQSISIYPNPTSGNFSLMGLDDGEVSVRVYSPLGVLLIDVEDMTASDNVLSVSGLSEGLYMVVVEGSSGREVIRLLKK